MDQLEWLYSFEEIERDLAKMVSALGEKLDHVSITWFENEHTYQLEFLPLSVPGFCISPGLASRWSIGALARISKYKDGWEHPENLAVLKKAGRDLYYRLRKKYPVKRDIGR